jgi:putative autotransporter adhesin-like protein
MTIAPTPVGGARPHQRGAAIAAGIAIGFAAGAIAVALLIHYDVLQGSSTGYDGVQGSGNAVTQTRDLPPFAAVELAGSNIVDVRVGGKQSVVVHADDNLLDKVKTHVEAGALVIDNASGNYRTKSPMKVEVTVPTLHSIVLSGSGIVNASGIDAPAVHVQLPGSGLLRAAGTTNQLDASLAGSGDAQLEGLVARHVRAAVSGSGLIHATATTSLDASVSGSGSILYGGNPARVTTRVSGSGAVVPGG